MLRPMPVITHWNLGVMTRPPYTISQEQGVAPWWVVWDDRHTPPRRVAQFIFHWEAIATADGLNRAVREGLDHE